MTELEINALREANVLKVLRDGPRMRMDYNVWIEARDTERGLVLLGGLGCMGVGCMWAVEEKRHADYPGYATATIRSSAGEVAE